MAGRPHCTPPYAEPSAAPRVLAASLAAALAIVGACSNPPAASDPARGASAHDALTVADSAADQGGAADVTATADAGIGDSDGFTADATAAVAGPDVPADVAVADDGSVGADVSGSDVGDTLVDSATVEPEPIATGGTSPATFSGGLVAWPAMPVGATVDVGKPPIKPGQAANPYPHYSAGLIDDFTGDGVADLLLFAQSGDAKVVHGPLGPKALVSPLPAKAGVDPRVHSAALWVRADGSRVAILAGTRMAAWRWTGTQWLDEGDALGMPQSGSQARHCTATVDVDADGLLDLLECRYLCDPGAAHHVWIDRGDGVLQDKGAALGLTGTGAAWTASAFDLHDDGKLDLIWTHDGCNNPNNTQALYENQGRSASGLPLFARVSPGPLFVFPTAPMPFASPMGCDAADFDGNGHLDLAIANVGLVYPLETAMKYLMTDDPDIPRLAQNNLLLQQTDATFVDAGLKAGLKSLVDPVKGLDITVWGIAAWDFDRDGWVDLAYAAAPDADSYENALRGPMHPMALRNQGNATFVEVSDQLGLPKPELGNTLSIGDLDGDGDDDWVVGQLAATALVLRNDIQSANHFLRVKLAGKLSNALGIGARVSVKAGSTVRTRLHGVDGSFATHHQRVSAFGVGSAKQVAVTVTWPSGYVQTLDKVATDQTLTIQEPTLAAISARVVQAGGSVTVTVQPHDAAAQPTVAPVEVALVPPGALAWTQPLACDAAGKCTGTLKAQQPGTTYLRIKISGQELQIWPKVTSL